MYCSIPPTTPNHSQPTSHPLPTNQPIPQNPDRTLDMTLNPQSPTQQSKSPPPSPKESPKKQSNFLQCNPPRTKIIPLISLQLLHLHSFSNIQPNYIDHKIIKTAHRSPLTATNKNKTTHLNAHTHTHTPLSYPFYIQYSTYISQPPSPSNKPNNLTTNSSRTTNAPHPIPSCLFYSFVSI